MKNSRPRFALRLLSILFLLASAYAQLTPSGDAYTNTADPSTNYGAQKLLDVESSQTTYIQFDLSAIPAGYTGSNIAKATLKLYVNTVPKAGSFNVDYVNGAWLESTLTASNAPALGTTIAASVPLTTTDKNQFILIDVTAAVQAWLNGTPNDGIALVGNSPVDATFDSKESTTTSHAAELVVVFAGSGGSGITGITTASGSGLIGGGTSGTLNLSLTNACASGQVLQWTGTSWICASVGTGTITGVTAGTDLTGGGASGNVTLNLNTANVPLLAAANTFTGNQTVSGNLNATGVVSGSSFQIGSNLFDYGSYANANAFLGFAGNTTTTGTGNTASGYIALSSNTTGVGNTASGYQSLGRNTTGKWNTAAGVQALVYNTTGGNNTAVGYGAGLTGDESNITGSNNMLLGYESELKTGNLNNATAIGANAEVSESNALVLGSGANVGIGTSTPAFPLDVVGTINSSTGFSLGGQLFAFGTYASNNALLGFAGNTTMTGDGNTASGYQALLSNAGGVSNTANGSGALRFNTSGFYNTAIGAAALVNTTTGDDNTSVGILSLQTNTTASYNTALGYFAGETSDLSNLTGSSNSAIGASAEFATGTLTNATAIGANAEVESSNAIVLGSIKGLNGASSNVAVGIGTPSPAATLDVHDNGSGNSTISATTSALNNAVYGSNTAASGSGANGGFFITSSPQGSGIVAQNTGTGGSDYAAYMVGNVFISGNVSKGGGSFKIDHPLDPANKYLYHSFVESPDMMNIYNGVAALDARGSVWITLPDYFEALNQDFRYQLTSIGRPQPSLYVAKEISGNRFRISGGKPGGKVSWQVTGIRHDAYADAHRIQVEEQKPPQEQGRYLHPELFGAPAEQAIGYPSQLKQPPQPQTAQVSSAKVQPARQ